MQLSFSAVRAEIFSGYKILFVVLFITYFNKNKTEEIFGYLKQGNLSLMKLFNIINQQNFISSKNFFFCSICLLSVQKVNIHVDTGIHFPQGYYGTLCWNAMYCKAITVNNVY